jgi:RNA-directed DNA polymerase
MSHRQLRVILDQRVRDGVMRRTIDTWRKAGGLEHGAVTSSDTGVPQGSGVSPIWSNLVLHEVLDTWFEEVVKPRLAGDAVLDRFADDALILCARENDATRVMRVLPQRFEKYGVTLHPEKTGVTRCTRPPRGGHPRRRREGPTWPGSVDLLGFTLSWATSRRGNWVVTRKTASDRLSRALRRINTWCREHRHAQVWWQHQQLAQKLRGHDGYDGMSTNSRRLAPFRDGVIRIGRTWLSRRSQRRNIRWERFHEFLKRHPLPQVTMVHRALKS